jgi:hypothetical protein
MTPLKALEESTTGEGHFMDCKDTDLDFEQIKIAAQKAAKMALAKIRSRSYSERHPELGKMINCQFCGLRHRQNERRCRRLP